MEISFNPPGASLHSSLGVLVIGAYVGAFLFGAISILSFVYYRQCYGDPRLLKITVGWIWALELVHTVLTGCALYWYTVVRFGQEHIFQKMPGYLSASGIIAVLITATTQCYFAYRLRVLSQNLVIACVCWSLIFIRSILYVVAMSVSMSSQVFSPKWRWVRTMVGTMSVATDLIVAGSLLYYMWLRRADRSISRLYRNPIDCVFTISLQTNLLTGCLTAVSLVLYEIRTNWIWLGMSFVVCRLFSISMLSALLGRRAIRESGANPVHLTSFIEQGLAEQLRQLPNNSIQLNHPKSVAP